MSSFNLINQRSGKLTVIEKIDPPNKFKGKRQSRWLCKCDCGREVIIRADNLISEKTKSCGCNSLANDLTGKKFGRLTVIGKDRNWINPKSGKINTKWICRCDCGEIISEVDYVIKSKKNACLSLNSAETNISHTTKNLIHLQQTNLAP